MRALFAALLLILCACDPRELVCGANVECRDRNGVLGLCVNRHCAFLDEQCASRYRFDDTAGADAERCVDEALITADAAPAPDAT